MKLEKYIDSDGTELDVKIYVFSDNIVYRKEYFKSYGTNGFNWWHRLGGPAVEYIDGYCDWYKEGKSHRIGGPAYYNIKKSHKQMFLYYVNGKRVSLYYICG